MIQRDWQSLFVTQIQTYKIIKYNSYFYSPTKSYLRENTHYYFGRHPTKTLLSPVELVVHSKWEIEEGSTDIL